MPDGLPTPLTNRTHSETVKCRRCGKQILREEGRKRSLSGDQWVCKIDCRKRKSYGQR